MRKSIGNAVPNEYPIIDPMPPQVEADTGPNKIQAPSADAVKLVVRENNSTLLFAVR